ncbi:SWIM zinc finger family protein [Streptomyces sp. TRM 70361]|uniref:DprA-like winged helix domain-containing protein n=1 Tax=Streptomyces sp. TRM 70361 TaxID=3116553 RepID=UPI002E7C2D17|nr:SWIM zinc finger family protein [Streptomyces sp. TRM 70361]MEE1942265.1 SWIM zinc finger family protein [Streptomyces sp. TRM 70361]
MTTTTAVQTYTYLRPSAVRHGAGGAELALETSGGATPAGTSDHPRFFAGFLTAPEAAAAALLSVADVAATRYNQRLFPASLDPVVTGNGDRLRFESFSGCCGVYARLDVLGAGLDGDEIGHGTTNVDVNTPLRDALARVGSADPLHLRVGPEVLEVTTFDGPVVEKKVPLPDRWLRGFAETQVIAAAFDPRAEVSAAEAVRFLRALPRARAGSALWVVPAGRGLRLTSRAVPGAVCLPGPDRLAALLRVLRHASGLRLYGPPVGAGGAPAASAWEVLLPGMRLTLTLSPDPARGFSGEGAVLDALATEEAAGDAELVSVLLAWEPRVDVDELARRSGLTPQRVRAALTVLGTAGRIGYDTAEAAHFHRELPFDGDRVERHNPRLRAARALVAAGAVRPEGVEGTEGGGADGTFAVAVDGHTHRVRSADGELSCTCRWWAEYRGGRGPCSHALAVRIVLRGAGASAGHGAGAEGARAGAR